MQTREMIIGAIIGTAFGLCIIASRRRQASNQLQRFEGELNDLYSSADAQEQVAIHRALDFVNARIEAGEFKSVEQMRAAALMEVEFQMLAIRSNLD